VSGHFAGHAGRYRSGEKTRHRARWCQRARCSARGGHAQQRRHSYRDLRSRLRRDCGADPRASRVTGTSDPGTSDPATSDPATSDPATSDPGRRLLLRAVRSFDAIAQLHSAATLRRRRDADAASALLQRRAVRPRPDHNMGSFAFGGGFASCYGRSSPLDT